MNVLVACEESQAVTIAFRGKGHNAFSCDLLEPSGNRKEWAIKQNVLPLLNGNIHFKTLDGLTHAITGKWDLLIAFPPCTNLCVSGARYFERKRKEGLQQESIKFFLEFTKADCDHISIENPVGIMSTIYKDPTQIIEPFQFGHEARKATCLWLKNLPPLKPTKIVSPGKISSSGHSFGACAEYATDEKGKILSWSDPRTAIYRSKTFQGIAEAMAQQWSDCSNYYNEQLKLF